MLTNVLSMVPQHAQKPSELPLEQLRLVHALGQNDEQLGNISTTRHIFNDQLNAVLPH